MVKIVCVSDLHGYHPEVGSGDILIVAGDLTSMDLPKQMQQFFDWFYKQEFKHKILVGGNHDNYLAQTAATQVSRGMGILDDDWHEFLYDTGCECEGLKIWGSPWTKRFPGMNPNVAACTLKTEEELEEKWKLIPEDTDILITHGPAYGILDKCQDGERAGCTKLRDKVNKLKNLKLHVSGHIHEAAGRVQVGSYLAVNASIMNFFYSPVNKASVVTL